MEKDLFDLDIQFTPSSDKEEKNNIYTSTVPSIWFDCIEP
ncbi:FDLD family class I lanthipeptide [Bacillus sp. FJAT-27245]|nr:FDLD family class I lanthipeptide [Bacillus sp. FJAT-27245]